jgi:hypothetical protein
MHIPLDAAPARAPAAVDNGLTPLATMLATMRWAHGVAEAARGPMAKLVGKDAVDAARAAKAFFFLRRLALKAAKAAAPYVHARRRPAAREDDAARRHEARVAELGRLSADSDGCGSTQQDRAASPSLSAAARVPHLAAGP